MKQHFGMAKKATCVWFNLSPLGFHSWADQYREDFRELPPSSHGLPFASLLLCRAIELEFKAWHRQAGRDDGLLDRFRHDLVASYRALPKKHQILSMDEVSALERASAFYLSQGFEDAEACRARVDVPVDVGGLQGVAETVMEHGGGLDLRW